MPPAVITAVVADAVRLLRVNAVPAVRARNTTGRSAPGQSLWVYSNGTTRPCRRCGTPSAWRLMASRRGALTGAHDVSPPPSRRTRGSRYRVTPC